jgi:hypothetical protein
VKASIIDSMRSDYVHGSTHEKSASGFGRTMAGMIVINVMITFILVLNGEEDGEFKSYYYLLFWC